MRSRVVLTEAENASSGCRKRVRALAAVLLAAVGMLALAGTASAHLVYPYKFQGYFDGHDSTAGAFTTSLSKVAINQGNGNLYVLDLRLKSGSTYQRELWISQFNSSGVAQNFSGLSGVSSFDAGEEFGGTGYSDLVFDNSGHGGGMYVNGRHENQNVAAYNADGTVKLPGFGGTFSGEGLGVDNEGWVYEGTGQSAYKFNPDTGKEVLNGGSLSEQQVTHLTFDSDGNMYVNKNPPSWRAEEGGLYKYGTWDEYKKYEAEQIFANFGDHSKLRFSYVPTTYSAVDPSTNDVYAIEEGKQVTEWSPEGQPITTFGLPEGTYNGLQGSLGLAVNKTTHDVYVTDTRTGTQPAGMESPVSPRIDVFHQQAPITVPDVTTEPAGHPDTTSGILKGVVNADNVSTTECKFEWGLTTQYTNGSVPCDQGNVFGGSSDNQVSHEVKSLTTGTTYHYRVAAKNANGHWSYGVDHSFEASIAPAVTPVIVDRVNTDGARFTSAITPHGGTTHYRFEVGPEDCASSPATPCTPVPVPDGKLKSNLQAEQVVQSITGLQPDSLYHVRIVAEDGAGSTETSYVFRTYPSPPTSDPCPNAHVRQQTSAALLPDCRAYELVSAANAGGYDVESDLVPGQTPFQVYPNAEGRVLYGLHFGSIPNIAGSPPNFGLDPYVAVRGEHGWTTEYVGLPAEGMDDPNPYGSPLLGADEGLASFAFGGPGICSPCFPGAGTNLPLRLNGGSPIEGMTGSLDPGEPTPGEPAPAGYVAKYLSADGSHLVFGSTKKFEQAGVEGALTIYQRDLKAGTTQVVSTDASGATLSGPGVAELDQSSDGSRVVIGKEVSKDAAGNVLYHLYLHIGTSAHSADLTPGGSAIFDGMTADGSKVFFTTTDKLLTADEDESADIYQAEVSSAGAVTIHLVSVRSDGSPSNSEECAPPGEPNSWNSVSGNGKCSAVAFADGAGLASGDGTFYFVSPEKLDGSNGAQDQANLYVVKPSATPKPKFVTTLDSSLVKPPPPPPSHPAVNTNFTGSSLSGPDAVTVDQSNGDVYVAETGAKQVARFKQNGTPDAFTEGPGAGTNKFGANVLGSSESELAVDNSGGPFNGDLYVTNYPKISVYSPTGAELGALTGSGTNSGSFGDACGVAIEQSTGAVYVGDYSGYIWRYLPTGSAPISDADYTVTGLHTTGMNPCQVAADSAGHVYAAAWANGPVKEFDASVFAPGSPPALSGTFIDTLGKAITTDPLTNELFVNEGNRIEVFKPNGEPLTTFGSGSISNSRGIAVNDASHHAYAPNSSAIVEFGYEVLPYTPIDNPAIVHGVRDAGTHRTSDFQVTPDGRYAVFDSSLSLTGFMNLGHYEIYRYDAKEEALECASCATTNAAAKTDTFLAPYGLNVSEDGRVFFTSDEGLVLSDTNERKDAYEWSGGREIGRISTGVGNTDSSLLSVSENGVDAFFFTRQTLVPSDENGGAVKIYDAREEGGYPYNPERLPCAASDECHGPGTQAPQVPDIPTLEGTGPARQTEMRTKEACRRGFVKRHGKCVKKRGKHRKRRSSTRGRRSHG